MNKFKVRVIPWYHLQTRLNEAYDRGWAPIEISLDGDNGQTVVVFGLILSLASIDSPPTDKLWDDDKQDED